MNELKPCPFCGASGTLSKFHEEYKVECSNNFCQASYMIGAVYDIEEEAIEAWNRRVSE